MKAEPVTESVPTELPFEMPRAWMTSLAGYVWTIQTIGRSSASVFQLVASDHQTLFAKTEPVGPFGELADEAARLKWLTANGIACPRVLAEAREAQRDWLLMSTIPGKDLASSPHLDPERIVMITANALRELHQLDVTACPFDHKLDERMARAHARMEAGLVDEADFDEERLGRTAADLFEELVARYIPGDNLAVTHGDACLPNLLAEGDQFTGFIDCGRLGVADRYQDLALASRSIRDNLGEGWIEPFLRYYGADVDPERIAFYRLLDEFF